MNTKNSKVSRAIDKPLLIFTLVIWAVVSASVGAHALKKGKSQISQKTTTEVRGQ